MYKDFIAATVKDINFTNPRCHKYVYLQFIKLFLIANPG